MIEIKEITFGYGRKKKKIFENFSMQLQESGIYGLLGKNGAGKSTLLYLITGLLFPQKGEVLYNGTNTKYRNPSALEDIFIIPEEITLPSVTLKNYVKINAPFYPRFSNEILSNCLQLFSIDENINLGQLSMGEKRKALISFALATNSRLLIMDEPTNGLDIPSKSKFRKAVAGCMDEERTIIISTHQVEDINNLLDHIIIIDDSKLLLNASATEICDKLDFIHTTAGEADENIIYSQPSVSGNNAIAVNNSNEASTLELELLFNATLNEPGKITNALKK